MKNILCSTVATVALTTAAFADASSSVFSEDPFDPAFNLSASEIIGKRVYASEVAIDESQKVPSIGNTDWEDIGEINDIILTRDGAVQSVIVGVGGFLGLGEKDVSVNMSELKFVEENGDAGDLFLVINANTAGLQGAPDYIRPGISSLMEAPTGLSAPIDMAENREETATVPLSAPQGFDAVASGDLSSEDLTGAPVLDANNDEIGEIAELLITDNEMDRAVIDVGGFLGLGEYPVTIPVDELSIVQAANGGDLRVYLNDTKEALKTRPAYQG